MECTTLGVSKYTHLGVKPNYNSDSNAFFAIKKKKFNFIFPAQTSHSVVSGLENCVSWIKLVQKVMNWLELVLFNPQLLSLQLRFYKRSVKTPPCNSNFKKALRFSLWVLYLIANKFLDRMLGQIIPATVLKQKINDQTSPLVIYSHDCSAQSTGACCCRL